MKHNLIGLLILLFAINTHAETGCDKLNLLKDYFANLTPETERSYNREMESIAFELGDKAIPVLENGVNHPDESKSWLAAMSLANIGGTNALRVIRNEYKKNPDKWEELLCRSLASAGSEADIDFLIQALQGKDWGVAQTSAYSLGILKAERAKDSLRTLAQEKPGMFSGAAAKEAIRWMEIGPWITPTATSKEPEEAVISAVLQLGVPNTENERGFYDPGHKCRWTLKGRTWARIPEDDPVEEKPSIAFEVFITEDAERAKCSVSLYFGPRHAYGYEYILKNINGNWTVIGMHMAWVS